MLSLRKIKSCISGGQFKIEISLVLFVSTKQLFKSSIMIGVAVFNTDWMSSRFEMMSNREKFGHILTI